MLERIPVDVENGLGHSKRCELIVLDDEKEQFDLSNNRPPKVLSVDSLLKATLSILLLICTAGLTYLFTKVTDHQDRLIRAEVWIESDKRHQQQILTQLREIREVINGNSQMNARLETRLDAIKHLIENKK